jgi:hypothetical protein
LAELYTKADRDRRRDRDIDPAHQAYDPAEHGDVVYLPDVTAAQLDELPLYEKNHLSPHTEMAIRKILEPERDDRYNDDDDFYRHDYYDDERFYRRRRDRRD